jgi:hypothetical protein
LGLGVVEEGAEVVLEFGVGLGIGVVALGLVVSFLVVYIFGDREGFGEISTSGQVVLFVCADLAQLHVGHTFGFAIVELRTQLQVLLGDISDLALRSPTP